MDELASWDVDHDLIVEVSRLLAGDFEAARLPRHRHDLGQDRVVSIQRARLLVAAAEEVVERGYAEVTTRGIMARAGVSSKTFYAMYSGKDSAFWDAFTLMGRRTDRPANHDRVQLRGC